MGSVIFTNGQLDEIRDEAGTGAPDFPEGIEISTSGVVVDYEEVSGSLDGDFTGGTYRAVRLGKIVTVTLDSATHASATDAVTTLALPATMRPTTAVANVIYNSGTSNATDLFRVNADGTMRTFYSTTGASSRSTTSPVNNPTISYVIV